MTDKEIENLELEWLKELAKHILDADLEVPHGQ